MGKTETKGSCRLSGTSCRGMAHALAFSGAARQERPARAREELGDLRRATQSQVGPGLSRSGRGQRFPGRVSTW